MNSELPEDGRGLEHFGVFNLDPTQDPRWVRFVSRQSKASIFHSVAWLRTLRDTYDYEPVVFTTSPPNEELRNGIVFCRVRSWLTGRRLVSLPFSDHCEPLCESGSDISVVLRPLKAAIQGEHWKYLELRPITGSVGERVAEIGFLPDAAYFLHVLELNASLDEIFRNLDKDSIQRRIQRAERAQLGLKCGRSDELLDHFYALFVTTRGRHHLPPIPDTWFQKLIEYQAEALEIRLAYQNGTPISGILTLRFKDTVYYKYGCSDERFNRLGATPWLMWGAITAAKRNGALKFDFGRTEADNSGLLKFKSHWSPHPERLTYWRFPGGSSLTSTASPRVKLARRIFAYMPKGLLKMTGRLIYRHIG